MAVHIEGLNAGETLQVNEDGSLSFFPAANSNQEVMSEEQAIKRWPHLRESIRAAIESLPG
jgi:hypothetical protein